MALKKAAWSVIVFVWCFLLYYGLTIFIHEALHLFVLRSFGGEGYIILTSSGGLTKFTTPPAPTGMFWVALSGGVGVAAIYAMFAVINYKQHSMEEFASLLPFLTGQLAYGLFEGFFVFSMPRVLFNYYGSIIANIGFIAGLIIALFITGQAVVDAILEKETDGKRKGETTL